MSPPLPEFRVKISNYRTVAPTQEVVLTLGPKVVFILGRNNAGKSNLLRFFVELQQLWDYCAVQNLAQLAGIFDLRFRDPIRWDSLANHSGLGQPLRVSVECSGAVLGFQLNPLRETHTNDIQVHHKWERVAEPHYELFRRIFRALRDAIYIGSTRSIRHHAENLNNVVTGHHFVSTWKQWTGGMRVEDRLRIDELTEELRALFGFARLSIQPNTNDSDLVIGTEEGSFLLSEYGDGLAHFIVVLSNAAIRRPEFIFIDEPENSLHPKLQITFVQALARRAKVGLVATSHAVGLARSVADDIWFISRAEGIVKLTPFGGATAGSPLLELLEMGYSQFVELGGANLLLVEGRTDIKAFREILRHFGLDQKFIVIGLGGGMFFTRKENDILHELDELKRLNAKSVVVIYDGGKTSATSGYNPNCTTFHRVCDKLGFKVHPTERNAIENYVSQAALDQTLGPGFKALTPYESANSRPVGNWDKNRNWQLFAQMIRADFEATDLGALFTDLTT